MAAGPQRYGMRVALRWRTMLRVNATVSPQGTTVTLEGRVVAAWLDELSRCWNRLLGSAARPIEVDLNGVTYVDAAGKAVLRAMHADGAHLRATTVMLRAVIDEIEGAARPAPPGGEPS
jgi:hypothetical protein